MSKRLLRPLLLSCALVLAVSCGDQEGSDGDGNNGGNFTCADACALFETCDGFQSGPAGCVAGCEEDADAPLACVEAAGDDCGVAIACFDGGSNNGGTNNGGTNNGGTNNGGTNNGGTNNGGTNNGGTNNGGTNNGGNNGGEDSCEAVLSGNYTPAEGDACDAINQTAGACADGEGCYLGEEGALCATAGSSKCGEACANANDCQPGMACVNDPGECRPLCETGGACSGDGQCAPLQGRDDVGVCIVPEAGPSCSVLTQDCPEGEACYLIGPNEECAPPAPAMVGAGESCEFANDCIPGLVCVGSDAENTVCLPVCATDGSVMCEAGECTGIQDFENLGVCVTE